MLVDRVVTNATKSRRAHIIRPLRRVNQMSPHSRVQVSWNSTAGAAALRQLCEP